MPVDWNRDVDRLLNSKGDGVSVTHHVKAHGRLWSVRVMADEVAPDPPKVKKKSSSRRRKS